MARKPTTLADTLRAAIEAHGTLYAVAKGSGVPYPTLHSFFSGDADVRLSTVQKLTDYLKLELAPKKATRRK